MNRREWFAACLGVTCGTPQPYDPIFDGRNVARGFIKPGHYGATFTHIDSKGVAHFRLHGDLHKVVIRGTVNV